jgi:uncharacterized protein
MMIKENMELRAIVTSLLVIAAVALALLFLLWLAQRSLIYLPDRSAPPADWLPPGAEEIELRTDDGLAIAGWFVSALGDGDASRPAVLVFNGNAGHRGHRVALAEALRSHGLHVLLLDYRGYGGNPGSPSEAGLRSDARAAAAWLASRPEVDPARIVYFGESLGGAVAVGLATERAPAALVLRSPFDSLGAVGRHHYPFLPIVDPLLQDRWPADEQIAGVEAPLLVVVAEDDRIVPVESSRRLFDAADEPKTWVEVAGAGHNDRAMLDGDTLIEAMAAFLEEHDVSRGD